MCARARLFFVHEKGEEGVIRRSEGVRSTATYCHGEIVTGDVFISQYAAETSHWFHHP
ncbi:hypothetical protein PLUA15_220068 [Pseudomonas lundensis]|uniref:Uncharacterized protein n=1 Tax=Pseudomonas lundensis TaxID=86185 RepID=A0AAX2H5J6_9PSED|nr:hypothetical protein PLUA15_220068 [Pseudomonas lundensis]